MENTFLTPEVVANEALMCLQSNLVMADLVHRDYADDFVSVGDTISIRKPAKFVAKNFTGVTEPQDITEDKVTVKLDRFRDVTVAVTSKEMTLDIADFSAQVVQPAMQAIAQAIDEDLLAVATEKAGFRMESEPNPSDLSDIATIAKQLDIAKAPVQNRSLVLHPEHKYRYALTEHLSGIRNHRKGFAVPGHILQARSDLFGVNIFEQTLIVGKGYFFFVIFDVHDSHSCTQLGNRLASVWGRKQAATKLSI